MWKNDIINFVWGLKTNAKQTFQWLRTINKAHSTSSLNLLQHHAVCFYKKSNKEMEEKVALNILFLFSILLMQGSYVEGIFGTSCIRGRDTRPVNNLICFLRSHCDSSQITPVCGNWELEKKRLNKALSMIINCIGNWPAFEYGNVFVVRRTTLWQLRWQLSFSSFVGVQRRK